MLPVCHSPVSRMPTYCVGIPFCCTGRTTETLVLPSIPLGESPGTYFAEHWLHGACFSRSLSEGCSLQGSCQVSITSTLQQINGFLILVMLSQIKWEKDFSDLHMCCIVSTYVYMRAQKMCPVLSLHLLTSNKPPTTFSTSHLRRAWFFLKKSTL